MLILIVFNLQVKELIFINWWRTTFKEWEWEIYIELVWKFIVLSGAGGFVQRIYSGWLRASGTHIEMNNWKMLWYPWTRAAFHYLKNNNQLGIYEKYLYEEHEKKIIKIMETGPEKITDSVISRYYWRRYHWWHIFSTLDNLVGKKKLMFIGTSMSKAYSVVGRAQMGKAVEKDPRTNCTSIICEISWTLPPKNVCISRMCWGLFQLKELNERPPPGLVNLAGYEMVVKVQIASKHGVLQKRHELLLWGWKKRTKKGILPYTVSRIEWNGKSLQCFFLNDLFADLPERIAGEVKLCEPGLQKSLDEMPYLKESGIRGTLEFTTQHIARPNNFIDQTFIIWQSTCG